jgi:hypothetical protein
MDPRDTPQPLAVAVNYETGQPLTEHQQRHLQFLKEAAEVLYEAMHNADGSVMPGEHQDHIFGGRRMVVAATYIETGLMYARRAVMEMR